MVIVGNHITGPSSTGLFPYAIDLEDVASARVSGNILTTNYLGVSLFGSGAYRVEGNKLEDDQIGIAAAYTTGAQIFGNSLDTGDTGILDAGFHDRIVLNVVCNYTTPIDTTSATDPILIGNRTNC